MKTIQELNEKMWYRFVRVIFIFIIIISFFSVALLSGTYLFDKKNGCTYIENYYEESNSKEPLNPYLSFEGFLINNENDIPPIIKEWKQQGISDFKIREALDNLYIQSGPLNEESKQMLLPAKERLIVSNDLVCRSIFSPNYPNWIHTLFIILSSIFWTFLTLGILEIFRRSFYYVILGKLFPPKN